MASYTETFLSKMDWAKPFQRTNAFPLDRSSLFTTYDDAVKYAKGDQTDPDIRGLCGTSYVGQIIGVYEEDVLSHYSIQPDRTLKKIGSDIELNIASADTAGIVKIGTGLEVTEDGAVNVTSAPTADAVDWDNIQNKPEFVAGNTIVTDGASTLEALKTLIHEMYLNDGIYSGTLESDGTNPAFTFDGTDFHKFDFIIHVIGGDKYIQAIDPDTGRVFSTFSTAESPVIETTNRITAEQLTALGVVIDENYVHTDNNFTTALKDKLDTLVSAVQADWNQTDTAATDYIKNKPVLSTVAISGSYNDLTDTPTPPVISTDIEADGTDDTKVASPKAVKDYVVGHISATYRPAGTYAFADLPAPSEDTLGFVYNVSDAFVTDANFREGVDASYPAGTNVAVVETSEGVYQYDCLAGFVDLSGYAKNSDLADVALSGSYNDLTDTPTLPSVVTYTLEAGETSLVIGPFGGVIISCMGRDTVTGEIVMCDQTVTSPAEGTYQLEVAISEAYANPIEFVVMTSA